MADIDNPQSPHGRLGYWSLRTYAYQWNSFVTWAQASGRRPQPAPPEVVVEYLRERGEAGASASTLRVISAAIARAHQEAGMTNPCAGDIVQAALADLTRDSPPGPRRSLPLTIDCYWAIRETARLPRMGRGGRPEREETAHRRGDVDIAMIGLMRDGRLRVIEAAALTWGDIEGGNSSPGRVRIGVDPEYRVLSADTMGLLERVRGEAPDDERVLGMTPDQITSRIGAAALQAGLGPGYGGESPRTGMIEDLETLGIVLLGERVADDSWVPGSSFNEMNLKLVKSPPTR